MDMWLSVHSLCNEMMNERELKWVRSHDVQNVVSSLSLVYVGRVLAHTVIIEVMSEKQGEQQDNTQTSSPNRKKVSSNIWLAVFE